MKRFMIVLVLSIVSVSLLGVAPSSATTKQSQSLPMTSRTTDITTRTYSPTGQLLYTEHWIENGSGGLKPADAVTALDVQKSSGIHAASFDNGCPGPVHCGDWYNYAFGIYTGTTVASFTRTEVYGNCFFFCFIYKMKDDISWWWTRYYGGVVKANYCGGAGDGCDFLYGPFGSNGTAYYDGMAAMGRGRQYWTAYVGWGPYSAMTNWDSAIVHEAVGVGPVAGSCCQTRTGYRYSIFADGGWTSWSGDV